MSVYLETVELYTPLSAAVKELGDRRGNKSLLKKIAEFFGNHISPRELRDSPRIVMAPPIVSPNLELRCFLDIANHLPYESLYCEYTRDKFVHINFEKHHLGEMIFFKENHFGHKEVTDSVRVVDFQKDQGKPMNAITTMNGENFIDFHHRLVKQNYPETNMEICDFSDWFENSRSFSTEFPYLRYLGLYLTDAILFSNFVTEKYESCFTHSMVIPAFVKLKELFGIKPLIVPIEPVETDDLPYWCYYPEKVRELI